MDAIRLMGEMVKNRAEYTKDNDCLGCAKLVISVMHRMITRSWQGAFHGVERLTRSLM